MEEIEERYLKDMFCPGCGWECGFPSCHTLHCGGGCRILREKYFVEVKVDENDDPYFLLTEKETGIQLPNIYF